MPFTLAIVVESLFLGVALAMDAMAVTLSNTLCEPDMPAGKKLAMPLLFAIFQMAMPIAGFFGGTLIAPLIEAYAGIVSLVILAFVGGKMMSRRRASCVIRKPARPRISPIQPSSPRRLPPRSMHSLSAYRLLRAARISCFTAV